MNTLKYQNVYNFIFTHGFPYSLPIFIKITQRTVDDQTVVNVYKPPSAFDNSVLPQFEKPSIVSGDFNSHNLLWGYDDTNQDGLRLFDWMTREDYLLLFK